MYSTLADINRSVAVSRASGIPASFVSAETTSMTYSNMTAERKALIDFSLRPILTAIEQRLSQADFCPNGIETRFDIDDFLRGSALERAQVYEILNRIGAMSVEQNVAADCPHFVGNDIRWGQPVECLGGRGLHQPAGAVGHDHFIAAVAPLHLGPELLVEDWRKGLKDLHSQVELVRGADQHDWTAPTLRFLSQRPQDQGLQCHAGEHASRRL